MTGPTASPNLNPTKGTKMKYQRSIAVTSVMTISAFALAACGAQGESGGDEQITITMSTFLDPAGQSGREIVLGELIDAFEDENPNIKIEVQTSQFSLLAPQFLAAAASNSAPDVAWVTVLDIDQVLENGLFADISDAFTEEDKKDLDDAFWQRLTEDEKTYGVVLSRVALGYLYRADLLEAAGVSIDDLDTWDAFTDAVAEVGTTGGEPWGFCQGFSETTPDVTALTPRIVSAQGSLFTDDGEPDWTTPEAVEALEYTAGLVDSGITPPDSVTWTTEDPYEQFSAGNCVASMAASTRIPTIQDQLGAEKTGFALFPSGEGNANVINGWTLGVWSGSPHQEAAAKWVAYLASADADKMWVEEAGQAPARHSTTEALELPDYLTVASEAFKDGWLPPAGSGGDYRPVMNKIVLDVLVNGADAKSALESAKEEIAKR